MKLKELNKGDVFIFPEGVGGQFRIIQKNIKSLTFENTRSGTIKSLDIEHPRAGYKVKKV